VRNLDADASPEIDVVRDELPDARCVPTPRWSELSLLLIDRATARSDPVWLDATSVNAASSSISKENTNATFAGSSAAASLVGVIS
jgi:hypothetical protein